MNNTIQTPVATVSADNKTVLKVLQKAFVDCFIIEKNILIPVSEDAEVRALELLSEITLFALKHDLSKEEKREIELMLNLVRPYLQGGVNENVKMVH